MSAPTATPTGSLPADGHDVRRVRDAPGQLRAFNDAGVLVPADVHVAATLGRLAGEREPGVLLAAALAVRAPRLGHVCVDLANVRLTVSVDEDVPADVDALPWPEPGDWLDRVARSALVVDAAGDGPGDEPAGDRPLRLSGSRLYLDRYWRYERRVLDDLRSRATAAAGVETTVLRDGLDRLFPTQEGGGPDLQRLAAAAAVLRRFAVVAGGPGTGKTTTVAGILALLEEQATAAGGRPPQVALAAPTGKAADRLQTRVREVAAGLATTERVRERLRGLGASTIHRLLGTRPDSSSRFRHDRVNPLPHDVVVVDETSMVSLSLMAKL
ncbi:MAG: AAA family ATPase, partial [Actinobacteria bacterium]|nr:AAA family ATPase [Actinomycetota bacterium]